MISKYLLFTLCLACAMWPSYSYAHRMLMDCMTEDGTVLVDVFFPDGKPAKSVKVEVYGSDGTLCLSGETDARGQFSFDAGDETYFKVVATGKLGHRVEQEVSLNEAMSGPSEKSEKVGQTEDEVRQRKPIPLREIFAGLGYIFGVAGILMYLKARSDLRKANVSSGDR